MITLAAWPSGMEEHNMRPSQAFTAIRLSCRNGQYLCEGLVIIYGGAWHRSEKSWVNKILSE
jgi:hypothetical protein